MKTIHLTDDLVFSDNGPYAQQILSDQIGKIIRYTLRKGQELDDRHAPYQPRYYVVISGEAIFKSQNQQEETCGAGSLLIFSPREESSIIALSDEVMVIGFLHWMTGG